LPIYDTMILPYFSNCNIVWALGKWSNSNSEKLYKLPKKVVRKMILLVDSYTFCLYSINGKDCFQLFPIRFDDYLSHNINIVYHNKL